MIIFSLVALFVALFPVCKAQYNIHEIKNRTDTISDFHKKASSLLFLAEYYMQDQPDSSISYANQALEIALNINDSLCICDAYKCLSISYAGKMDCSQSETFFLPAYPLPLMPVIVRAFMLIWAPIILSVATCKKRKKTTA